MTRPTKDQWLMRLAADTATRTTCLRKGVGCVLADERGRVLSTGYNGPPRDLPHCNQDYGAFLGDGHPMQFKDACPGADRAAHPDGCEAVHAEINALINFAGDAFAIQTCCVTTEPCFRCAKALLNTGCARVLFLEHNGDGGEACRVWTKARGLYTPHLGDSQNWLLVSNPAWRWPSGDTRIEPR